MGVGDAKTDAKALDAAIEELTIIAGQRPGAQGAQVDRELQAPRGDGSRARVTLRGARMYEFLDRLVSIALPRIRDFRGLNPGFVRRPRQLLARRPRADHLPGDRLRLSRVDPGPRRHDHDLGADGRAGAGASAQPRASVRSRRQEGQSNLGQERLSSSQKRGPVQGAEYSLQQVRPPACGVQEVRPLPDLPARARAQGPSPA